MVEQDDISRLIRIAVEVKNINHVFDSFDQQGKMLVPKQPGMMVFRDWFKTDEESTGVSEAAGINCRMPNEALSPNVNIAHDWRTSNPTEIIENVACVMSKKTKQRLHEQSRIVRQQHME